MPARMLEYLPHIHMHPKVLHARLGALEGMIPEESPARGGVPALVADDDEEGVAHARGPLEQVVAAMAAEGCGLLEGDGAAAADLRGAGLGGLLLGHHEDAIAGVGGREWRRG